MGACNNKPLYQFNNFVTIEKRMPKPGKGISVSNFEFQIHPFSTDYIREKIDSQYNEDTDGTEESFIVSQDDGMKVFESKDELVTKRDKISDCLKNALIGKIYGESSFSQETFIKFIEPQGKDEYKKKIFDIIIETLIDIDLTCFGEGRGNFGVYFDWPVFVEGKKEDYIVEMIREIYRKNNLMDISFI